MMTTFGDVLIHVATLAPDDYEMETSFDSIHITLVNLTDYEKNGEVIYRHDFSNKTAIDAFLAWLNNSATSFHKRGHVKSWNFEDFTVYVCNQFR